MNIFRKYITNEQVEQYENQLLEFENKLEKIVEHNKQLEDQIVLLTNKIVEKQEELIEKEEIIVEKQEVIEELEQKVEETTELVEEVVDNIGTVEKQAAIKALEILADCGHNEAIEVVEAPEEIDLLSQAKKLRGQELVDFFKNHKNEYMQLLKK